MSEFRSQASQNNSILKKKSGKGIHIAEFDFK